MYTFGPNTRAHGRNFIYPTLSILVILLCRGKPTWQAGFPRNSPRWFTHQPSPRHLTPPARTGSGLPSVGCCNLWIWNCCWMQPRPRSPHACRQGCLCLSQFHSAQEMESWEDVLLGAYTYTQMYILYIYMYIYIYTLYIYPVIQLYISFSNNMWKICTQGELTASPQASSRFQGPRRQFAQGEDEGRRLLRGAN